METVCDGCRNNGNHNPAAHDGSRAHTCKCKTRSDRIKIDSGLEQTAGATDPANPRPEELKASIIGSIKDLPPMPQVVIKIQGLISDLESNTGQVAEIIESDQAIATKVLKMANSAFYGMSGRISSIHQASLLLGYQTLGEIVTMAGAADILSGSMPGYGYESEELWKHSLAVAFTAKMIAEMKNPSLIHEAHTAGLIHDVGKIILDPFILENKKQFSDYMEESEKTFLQAEQHFLGFDHSKIASEICKNWNIPETISLAIGWHHRPSMANGDLLSYILHLADYLTMMGGIGYDEDDALSELEIGTMDFVQLSQADIGSITFKVLEAVNDL